MQTEREISGSSTVERLVFANLFYGVEEIEYSQRYDSMILYGMLEYLITLETYLQRKDT